MQQKGWCGVVFVAVRRAAVRGLGGGIHGREEGRRRREVVGVLFMAGRGVLCGVSVGRRRV